jgi:hypothetical protein
MAFLSAHDVQRSANLVPATIVPLDHIREMPIFAIILPAKCKVND